MLLVMFGMTLFTLALILLLLAQDEQNRRR